MNGPFRNLTPTLPGLNGNDKCLQIYPDELEFSWKMTLVLYGNFYSFFFHLFSSDGFPVVPPAALLLVLRREGEVVVDELTHLDEERI